MVRKVTSRPPTPAGRTASLWMIQASAAADGKPIGKGENFIGDYGL